MLDLKLSADKCAFGIAEGSPMQAAHTFGEMAKALNRSPVYLRGLQARFELPVFDGPGYSAAYCTFLRNVISLRTLGISEENLLRLWQFEKKLLQLLHVDSTGSKTWFLDACGQTSHPSRRLLLSNFDLGLEVPSKELQLGLNFADGLSELFRGAEMGEDALRVLNEYIALYGRIRAEVRDELPHLRETAKWAARLP